MIVMPIVTDESEIADKLINLLTVSAKVEECVTPHSLLSLGLGH